MIKLFRNTRRKLLSENKFSKYLAYAIGEIFLVVVGILIALWINNKNQERINEAKAVTILKEIQRDLKKDINGTKGLLISLSPVTQLLNYYYGISSLPMKCSVMKTNLMELYFEI